MSGPREEQPDELELAEQRGEDRVRARVRAAHAAHRQVVEIDGNEVEVVEWSAVESALQ